MFESILLGMASFVPNLTTSNLEVNNETFFEEKIVIEAGISRISTRNKWNAMTLFSPTGEELPKIWYEKHGEFVPWHIAETKEDDADKTALDLLFAGNIRNNILIKSDKTVEVVAHFFNTKIEGENNVAFAPLDDDSFDDPKTGLAKYVKKPRYISRKEWGADETLRVWKVNRGIFSFFRKTVPEAKWAPKYMLPKSVTTKNEKGEKLIWPIEKSPQVKKIIIHHTGEYVDEKRNPKELMRAIYYYHTLTRGWGDIGYNYVVDKQGNIYEGRYGGPLTVGAHVAYYNLGTIGIALMGNFNNEKPTIAQQKILTLIIADHANRFSIDPLASSEFLNIDSPNVAGHKDVTRKGHGTSCPGTNLYKLLPEIRKEASALMPILGKGNNKISRDFLTKSKIAPKFIRKKKIKIKNKSTAPISLGARISRENFPRDTKKTIDIIIKNGTSLPWAKNSIMKVKHVPSGMTLTNFKSVEPIYAGRKGIFRATINVKSTPNGKYDISLIPIIKDLEDEYTFELPILVSGERMSVAKFRHFSYKRKAETNNVKLKDKLSLGANLFGIKGAKKEKTKAEISRDFGKNVKIKLAFFKQKYAVISGSENLQIFDGAKRLKTVKARTRVKIIPIDSENSFKIIIANNGEFFVRNPKFKSTNGYIEIHNYDRGLGKIAYNKFREQLNFHLKTAKEFIVVNELPIEQYLYGLAEEPSHEPIQKKHAIYILARSYIYVYSGTKRKFKTFQYDLEDDPKSSQFYLGYDWEKYHVDQIHLINQTRGMVLTYNNQPVIGPYFTQSSGRSSDKWSRQYPWTYARELPYDRGLEQKGHGVGLSGNSSRVLAEKGKTYKEILNYFYKDINVKTVY